MEDLQAKPLLQRLPARIPLRRSPLLRNRGDRGPLRAPRRLRPLLVPEARTLLVLEDPDAPPRDEAPRGHQRDAGVLQEAPGEALRGLQPPEGHLPHRPAPRAQ